MKLRSLAIGLTLVTAGTVIGVTTQQLASAEISSGDRPVLVPVEPCRIVDTRPGDATVGPRSSPLGAADTLTVDAQEPDTDCTGLIPTDALSLSLNVTAVGATEQTFLTIWADGPRPDASSLNPAPGAPPAPNAVTVDLSAAQAFEIYNDRGDVNIIVDINGYYEHHNHDDLYANRTRTEAISFPAHGLNVSDGSTIITREATGLNWENSFSNSAALYVQRPANWTGSGTVTYRILYFRTSTMAGNVEFFARPDSVDAGDTLLDASSISGTVDTDVWDGSGFGGFREITIEIPAARLDADWWKITLQRNSGFAGAYPDDIRVTSVALEYDAEY
jgi:hypothetical protein